MPKKIHFKKFLIKELMGGGQPSTIDVLGSSQSEHNNPEDEDAKADKDFNSGVDYNKLLNNFNNPGNNHPGGDEDHLFMTLQSLLNNEPLTQHNAAPVAKNPYEVSNSIPVVQYGAEHEKSDTTDDKFARLMGAIEELRAELKGNQDKNPAEFEENEEDSTSYATARQLFQSLVNQKMSRKGIINAFKKRVGVTDSTAVSYYQRLAKEAGLTTSGDRDLEKPDSMPNGMGAPGQQTPMGMPGQNQQPGGQQGMQQGNEQDHKPEGHEVSNDPDRQGLIRTVKGAHLVYKRKNNEGTYDELWQIGITGDNIDKALETRRNILAGTDIPPRATKSQDGSQTYTLTTLGTAQLLVIKNLPQ